jgi:hypothetical protein
LAKALDEEYLELIKRLADRLERLSVDSTYAHRASGLRGTFLRDIERIEAGVDINYAVLDQLIEYGFEILRQAAKEIGASR